MKKGIFAGLMLAAAAICMAQVDPARVIATVNGVDIKGAEYYHRMEFLPGVGKNLGDGFAEFPPGFLTLDALITERLVFQLAKERGVMPSEPEVQAELDYRKSKDPNLVVNWLASGRSQAEMEYDVKFDLAQFKLLTAGVTVTDQQVEDFYAKNRPMFLTPKEVALRVIVVRSQADADTVDKDLAGGTSFADEAKAKSADVTSARGGEYGTVAVSMLAKGVQDAVTPLTAGQTTPWFTGTAPVNPAPGEQPARFKFLVEKIVPETLLPLTLDLRRQIRQRMMMDSGKIKNHLREDLNALRAKATIDIKDKVFADSYKKFVEAYLKASSKG